jgi:uncharacterized protein YebE (UPF0316 family)
MGLSAFLGSGIFTYLIVPALIFLARIVDVSMGTIRVIFVSRGLKHLAPVLGFFEVLIWLIAIGQIMRNLTNVICYIAYAGGFAMGTFVGIFLEEKLSIGEVIVRIITKKDATELVEYLKYSNYSVTSIDAQGTTAPVKIIFAVLKRQDVPYVIKIINKFNPNAFYSIEDVRHVKEGSLPEESMDRRRYMDFLRLRRKAK